MTQFTIIYEFIISENKELLANMSKKDEKLTFLIENESKDLYPLEVFNPEFLQAAFDEAIKANKEGEVPVGCVFVTDRLSKDSDILENSSPCKNKQQIIARGRNTVNKTKNATRHAEMNCIDDIHYSLCKGK